MKKVILFVLIIICISCGMQNQTQKKMSQKDELISNLHEADSLMYVIDSILVDRVNKLAKQDLELQEQINMLVSNQHTMSSSLSKIVEILKNQ